LKSVFDSLKHANELSLVVLTFSR